MYAYDQYDRQIISQRVAQYRDQTERYLAGKITEEQFLPLRLQNGLYVQRLAPMLRIAVPYGTLNSQQLRKLAFITREYDKGYAHISTRQNVQLNWPKLEEVPDILEHLAEVEMHSIQTSGNCIRNVTSDQFAGIAEDEIEDPRPYCEIIRQWSTFHPEFSFLPRKFKIAVSGATDDRAAVKVHDIGLYLVKNDAGEVVELRCTYDPETKGGNAPDGRKVKGTIHWVSAEQALKTEVRLYDRLFSDPKPDSKKHEQDWKSFLNPESMQVCETAYLEPSLKEAKAEESFQFERTGYFNVDSKDSVDGKPVFNRTVTLRDSWAKQKNK